MDCPSQSPGICIIEAANIHRGALNVLHDAWRTIPEDYREIK